MGLFWSMAPPTGDPEHSAFAPAFGRGVWSLTVGLTVRSGDRVLARRDLIRELTATAVGAKPLTVADDGVAGFLYLPAPGATRRPGVLMLSGSDGDAPYLEAALLAAHGYPALALDYFGGPGLPDTLKDVPVEYFTKAARLLSRQPGADPASVVVSGYSRGSEAALLLAQTAPDLIRGVVLYAPSDVANGQFPMGPGSGWTVGGKPVERGSTLQVDRVNGPVLAIAGGDDRLWPSQPQAEVVMTRLDVAGGRYPHRALIYPQAGHGVGVSPYLPPGGAFAPHSVTGDEEARGGSRAANAAARAGGWPQVLDFLKRVPSSTG
jgi:dienelactone hydrolase